MYVNVHRTKSGVRMAVSELELQRGNEHVEN
jgi:hypothetical protein